MWYGKEQRRSNSDWVSVAINLFNIFSWVVFLIALVIFHYARPEVEYFIYQMVNEQVNVRTDWLVDLKGWLEITLYFCLSLSLLTIVLNQFRLKRRTDRQRYNMYMLFVMSLVFFTFVTAS
jgi:hypothetical protein